MLKRTFLRTALLAAVLPAVLSPAAGAVESDEARKEPPVLTVGMDAAYPPFGSRNTRTGEYEGFDVDVIRAIGRAEGFRVVIRNMAFDGLIPALKAGNIDIAINDITITPERAKSVAFSKRYYIAGLGVVVNLGDERIRTAKDLEGKTLAVSIGSTGEEAARGIPNARVRVFNQLNECFLELRNKGVDAVVNDIPTNDYYAAQAGRGRVLSLPVALTEEDLGIAVRKDNAEMLRRIDSGLAKIKASGEFSAIYAKWFGKEPPAALLVD